MSRDLDEEIAVDTAAWKADPMLRRRLVPADDADLADIRVRFLSAERFNDDRVRDPILASWWRSRELNVPADRIDLPYIDSRDNETPLIRSARPVLRRLDEQLDGQPISIILTDQTGIVLLQHTGDTDLHRHLEHVDLAPGFSYGEKFVGTNGIGTALAENQPVHVFGHEHYAENLENLACAGVPVRHPVSGKTIGAIDLTCWRKDAGRLLMALARSTADQIRQALLNYGDARELALFRAYLAACRRTMGMVMAFDEEAVVMNDRARQLLDPADQSVIIGQGTTALNDGHRETTVTLATGTKVGVRCRPIAGRDRHEVTGGVLIVDFLDSEQDIVELGGPVLPMFLPGTVGSASTWLRCCHQVDTAYGRAEWSILSGEAGVGKHAIARGVHQRRNPLARMHVLDVATTRQDRLREQLRHELIEDPVGTLVLRHAHRMSPDAMTEVADELRDVVENHAGRLPWVALTADSAVVLPDDLRALFPLTIEVPPLRRHIEDLPEIVPLMLNRLCPGAPLTCSPAAMHLLSRASWPGNAAQLYLVLKQVTQHRRAGTIVPADLPAEFRTAPRRPLNRIESVERDAIVRGLEDAGGNKVRAAKLLGMSRATIYRKIHNYGIVVPAR